MYSTLKLAGPLGRMLKPACNSVYVCRCMGIRGKHSSLGRRSIMSKVDATQSSNIFSCMRNTTHMHRPCMTFTRQVINSTSSLCFECAVKVITSPTLLVPFVFKSAFMCNSVLWYLWHLLHVGSARHVRAMCPSFKQFLHRAPLLTMSQRSSRDMPWSLVQAPSQWFPPLAHAMHAYSGVAA